MWSECALLIVYMEKHIEILGILAIVISWRSVFLAILAYVFGKK